MTINVGLLNGMVVGRDGHQLDLPHSARRLVAFLALQGRAVTRSYVAEQMWLESSTRRAFGNLRSALWRLNRDEPALVRASTSQLSLGEDVEVDVRQVEASARRLVDDTLSIEAGDLEADAYQRELLPGWHEDWVLMQRERLRQLCLHAIEAVARFRLAEGSHALAIEAAMAAAALEPLRESPQRLLVRIHADEGNLSEALRTFQLFRARLGEDLGVEPSPAFRALLTEVMES